LVLCHVGHWTLLQAITITTGTDRKIVYWDVFDGSAVRITEASDTSAMCDVAVDTEGEVIVSGGADKLVQVWGYDQGFCYLTGVGHSGTVNRVRVSPDRLFIVSVGSEGGIFVWKFVAPAAQGDVLQAAADVQAAC
jgi:cilia- and flagella-associated protein 52